MLNSISQHDVQHKSCDGFRRLTDIFVILRSWLPMKTASDWRHCHFFLSFFTGLKDRNFSFIFSFVDVGFGEVSRWGSNDFGVSGDLTFFSYVSGANMISFYQSFHVNFAETSLGS